MGIRWSVSITKRKRLSAPREPPPQSRYLSHSASNPTLWDYVSIGKEHTDVWAAFHGFLRINPPLGFLPLHRGLYTWKGTESGPLLSADRCKIVTARGAD